MKLTLVSVLTFVLTADCADGASYSTAYASSTTSDSPKFMIRHRASGLYLFVGMSTLPLVNYINCEDCYGCVFEKVIDHWGYIKMPQSGWYIAPAGGSLNPAEGTSLTVELYSTRHWGGLFALDAAHDHIIHKGGSYVHLTTGQNQVEAFFTFPVLRKGTHDAMRFQFVSAYDVNKLVLVYGKPTMTGKWKIINMVRNPMAVHESTIQVKIGKSVTQSRTTSFKYGWEVSVSMGFEFSGFSASVSASASFESMASSTSSATWSTETTRTRKITVKPTETVVTWQFVFFFEQNSSKGVFQSELLADTASETTVPQTMQYKV